MIHVDLSPRGVRAIARVGYVFLFPLVASYGLMYAEAIDPSSPRYGGGFGRWTSRRQADSRECDVSTGRATTLDSSAWLDVRAEPWVLSIPPVDGDRATVVTDLWGFVVDETASGGSPTHPVVVAGDAWAGSVPSDATCVMRVESHFVRCETRIRLPVSKDLASVHELQGSYGLEPVSAWSTGSAPPPAPAIAWWPADSGTLTSMEFWSAAAFALTLTERSGEDRGILDRLAEIGIAAGVCWSERDLPAEVGVLMDEGMDEALTELMRAATDTGDHSPIHRSRLDTDRDYFARALAVLRTSPLFDPSPSPRLRA